MTITQQPDTTTPQAHAQADAMPLWLKRTMRWLLRSPFHRLVSGSIVLIFIRIILTKATKEEAYAVA